MSPILQKPERELLTPYGPTGRVRSGKTQRTNSSTRSLIRVWACPPRPSGVSKCKDEATTDLKPRNGVGFCAQPGYQPSGSVGQDPQRSVSNPNIGNSRTRWIPQTLPIHTLFARGEDNSGFSSAFTSLSPDKRKSISFIYTPYSSTPPTGTLSPPFPLPAQLILSACTLLHRPTRFGPLPLFRELKDTFFLTRGRYSSAHRFDSNSSSTAQCNVYSTFNLLLPHLPHR